MTITTVYTKIRDYIPDTQCLAVSVKTNLCKKTIDEYPPILVSLASTTTPWNIDSAVKQVIASSYYAILARHELENKDEVFLNQLALDVANRMNQQESWQVGVDIPAPPEQTLQDETSISSTINSDVDII